MIAKTITVQGNSALGVEFLLREELNTWLTENPNISIVRFFEPYRISTGDQLFSVVLLFIYEEIDIQIELKSIVSDLKAAIDDISKSRSTH